MQRHVNRSVRLMESLEAPADSVTGNLLHHLLLRRSVGLARVDGMMIAQAVYRGRRNSWPADATERQTTNARHGISLSVLRRDRNATVPMTQLVVRDREALKRATNLIAVAVVAEAKGPVQRPSESIT